MYISGRYLSEPNCVEFLSRDQSGKSPFYLYNPQQ